MPTSGPFLATSFNESTESIEQEQEQEVDSPTETDLSAVNDVQAEPEDVNVDDDDSLLLPKPVLDRCWAAVVFLHELRPSVGPVLDP